MNLGNWRVVRFYCACALELTIEGRSAGAFTGKNFACGLNIASHTANGWEPGGPWNTQATSCYR